MAIAFVDQYLPRGKYCVNEYPFYEHCFSLLVKPWRRLDWMFHCHIIEHQETGMMGYIRVV